MGAPESGMQAADLPTAETLLGAFRTIKAAERAKHENVLNYWLSIRGNKEFPPLHDLDPLEISDAGPSSILLELIGGGQDAEIRHLGDAIAAESSVNMIIDAPNPSVLSCIARKLPIVAISRDILAFEDSYSTPSGSIRCWVTLLPLSSCGSWVDYVYAYVSFEEIGAKAAKTDEPGPVDEEVQPEVLELEEPVAEEAAPDEGVVETEAFVDDVEPELISVTSEEPVEAVEAPELACEPEPQPEPEPDEIVEVADARNAPGFSKLLDGLANLTGFYGQNINIDPQVPVEPLASEPEPVAKEPAAEQPVAEEPAFEEPAFEEPVTEELVTAEISAEEPVLEPEPEAFELVGEVAPEETAAEELVPEENVPVEAAPVMEGSLQTKLSDVRAKADEAREAQRRATQALHQGLSAAYDFALDAEGSPEEYLRLVEGQGLKIKLREPMAPVARLAFDGVCDADTIGEFEAVLAWALRQELPRGALLEHIEQAGGIGELLAEISRPS